MVQKSLRIWKCVGCEVAGKGPRLVPFPQVHSHSVAVPASALVQTFTEGPEVGSRSGRTVPFIKARMASLKCELLGFKATLIKHLREVKLLQVPQFPQAQGEDCMSSQEDQGGEPRQSKMNIFEFQGCSPKGLHSEEKSYHLSSGLGHPNTGHVSSCS